MVDGVAAAAAAAGASIKPVWMDCDPGHDDAMAIMLAGYSPAIKLLGISCVASNQTVSNYLYSLTSELAALAEQVQLSH